MKGDCKQFPRIKCETLVNCLNVTRYVPDMKRRKKKGKTRKWKQVERRIITR